MAVPCAVLMCHAPIVIPEIAGARAGDCARTTAAMSEAAQRLLAHAPELLVIVSPHTPRDPLRFGVVADAQLEGDFSRFGVPEIALQLPGAPEDAAILREAARARGLATWSPSGKRLDHGALVPLYFMHRAGWRGKTLLLALPFPDTATEAVMGRAIADLAARTGQRVCVLASGDMSHRLTRDAPAGYHPAARQFDARFRELLASGQLERLAGIEAGLREIAAEDVVDSCTVAAASVGFDPAGHRVLSYEGPFGVGYLEAILHEAGAEPRTLATDPAEAASGETAGAAPPRALLGIARQAIAACLSDTRFTPAALPEPWANACGVFVTLRTLAGELRGCVGHVEPACDDLAREVAACAAAAATRDTRFPAVSARELDRLTIEISLLSNPEPVASLGELDPRRYGVVVSSDTRRGVLLPDIEGVDSARDQVRIAAAKAGLRHDEPLRLERFVVRKLEERPEPAHRFAKTPASGGGRELN